MIEAIKIDDIGIELAVNGIASGDSQHELFTDSFSELKVRITNRTSETIAPFIRIQPSIRNQPHNISLDLAKKLVWNGILQEVLPDLPAKGTAEISIGLTPLARGEFEISVSVEEARLNEPPQEQKKTEGGRPRANTKTMMDAILGAKERRIWHSREPCIVVVRDEDSDDDDE
jgi:hypothetical protein